MIRLQDLQVEGKRVFVRCDLDVPLKNGQVQDPWRLENAFTTMRYLLDKESQVLLAGHLGRPENNLDFSVSTKNLVTILSSLLNINVVHFPDFADVVLSRKTLGLLENLRFWQGEEKNSQNFAKQLAALVEVYINEAFATSHREHASIVSLPKLIPAAAGFHFQKEVEVLGQVLKKPKRPQVVVIGGVKLETKLPVITNLARIADFVLVGGLIAGQAQEKKIFFGENVILANLTLDRKDIDNASIEKFCQKIQIAAQIVWNGPVGVFEEKVTETGTRKLAEAIVKSKGEKIAGGGETILALKKFGAFNKMDWVSSGGGAMLEFLAKGTLPGIEVLK